MCAHVLYTNHDTAPTLHSHTVPLLIESPELLKSYCISPLSVPHDQVMAAALIVTKPVHKPVSVAPLRLFFINKLTVLTPVAV